MKRATIYFEEGLHKALKIKAAEGSTSVSDFVNDAVKASLAEDLDDLQSFAERDSEPSMEFEVFLKKLRANGGL